MRKRSLFLKIQITCLIILAFITVSIPKLLVYVEVEVDGFKKYVKLKENLLEIPIESHRLFRVRVDSLSPLKPSEVFIDNKRLYPSLKDGVMLIEDYLEVNLSKARVSGKNLKVKFSHYEPKPFTYVLVTPLNIVHVKKGEFNINLEKRGKLRPWGAYVTALSTDKSIWRHLILGKFTLLDIIEHKVTFCSINASERFFELTYLVTASKFGLNYSAAQDVVSIYYIPLYYYPLNVTREGTVTLPKDEVLEVKGEKYVYMNLPALVSANLMGESTTSDIFKKLTLLNPFILNINQISNLSLSFRPLDIFSDKNVTIIASINNLIFKNKTCITINGAALLNNGLYLKIFREGEMVGYYRLMSFAPRIHIGPKLFTVKLLLINGEGRYVTNATVEMYRGFSKKVLKVRNGTLVITDIPVGKYLVRVLKRGVEVARKNIEINRDTEIALRCKLADLKINTYTLLGNPVKEFEVTLKGIVTLKVQGLKGVAYVKDLPVGEYLITLTTNNGTEFFRRKIILERFTELDVNSSLKEVDISIANLMNYPIPDLDVIISDSKGNLLRLKTNSNGSLSSLYLIANETYALKFPTLGYVYEIKIKDIPNNVYTVRLPCLVVWKGTCYDLYIVVTLIAVIALLICLVIRMRGRSVIVLEEIE